MKSLSDNWVFVVIILCVVFGSCRIHIDRTPGGSYTISTEHGLGCDCRGCGSPEHEHRATDGGR